MTGHEWDQLVKLPKRALTIEYKGEKYEGVTVTAGRDNFPFGFCERRDTGFAWMTDNRYGFRNICSLDIAKVQVISVNG